MQGMFHVLLNLAKHTPGQPERVEKCHTRLERHRQDLGLLK